MTMEQSQSRIGIFPAAENLRNYRYYGVSMTTDVHGHAAWVLGGEKIAGVLMNDPYEGEAAYVAFSGVMPVKLSALSAAVSVGDKLVANRDGTFSKGPGAMTALYDSTGGGIIPALVGAYHGLDEVIEAESYFIRVASLEDLPEPDNTGLITLAANTGYQFITSINFGTYRLAIPAGSTLLEGLSSTMSVLTYEGTGTFITVTNCNLQMRYLTFRLTAAGTIFNVTGDNTQTCTADFCQFTSVGSVGAFGAFTDIFRLRASSNNWINLASGLYLDMPAATAVSLVGNTFNNCGTHAIDFDGSVIARVSITSGQFVVNAAQVGLIKSGATFTTFVLEGNAFTGAGTYLSGMGHADSFVWYSDNFGIQNSSNIGYMYMINNATTTNTGTLNQWTKVAGVTTASASIERFTMPADNRLKFVGTQPFVAKVDVNLTAYRNSGAGSNLYEFAIFKNGVLEAPSQTHELIDSTIEGVTLHTIVQLAINDELEIYVRNTTDTDTVVIEDLAVVVTRT